MIGGRYTLVRELGRGGMGAVWLAHDEVLHREVAAKRLGHGALDVARAAREARLAASLNHPHVVAVFDLVEEPDERWLIMEHVAGHTLAALTAEAGPLPPQRVAHLLAQAAEALAAAHAGGVVHRDVKPSNMLVTADDTLKLTDFGIARALGDVTMTQTGMVTGSPAYLSPEVARGERAEPASDVWSLGASAFHALTGRPPYESDGNPVATLYQVVHHQPPTLPDAHPLAPLLRHTLAIEPADRWTMAEVHAFLGAQESGSAPPPDGRALGDSAEPTSAGPTSAGPTSAGPTSAEPTQLLTAAVPGVDLPPADPRGTPPTPPTPPAEPLLPESGPVPVRRPDRAMPGIAAAVGALALLLVVAWVAARTDDDPGRETSSPSSTSPSPDASESGSPTASPTPGPTTPVEPTAQGLRAFVRRYLETVTRDQRAGWAMLTPQFQEASGSFGQYQRFWRQWDSATPRAIRADPEGLRVEYAVRYVAGSEVVDDRVALRLVLQDGSYLIDEES